MKGETPTRLRKAFRADKMNYSDIRRKIGQWELQRGVAMQAVAPPRRWLRRFPSRMSLRTLMLIVLVVGGGLGWFALQRQRESRRQWVIAAIAGLTNLEGINLSGASITGSGLVHLTRLSKRTVGDTLRCAGERGLRCPGVFSKPPAPCQRFRSGKRLTGTASRVVPTKEASVASSAAPADTLASRSSPYRRRA
jgi:hypothetical protein